MNQEYQFDLRFEKKNFKILNMYLVYFKKNFGNNQRQELDEITVDEFMPKKLERIL
ncbi:hypothetical protein HYE31_00830 [Mycoplasmopsis bovis]|nr:hypothetical protein HYE31_00830 [Mycoplasmopsis bovis]